MSLYYEAEDFVATPKSHTGSLKSRIFGTKGLRSSPTQLFALVSEASKWSPILREVVEKSQILLHERKASGSFEILFLAY